MKELIAHIKSKPHYVKVLNILVLNGLLDTVDSEIKSSDGINYINLVINVVSFIHKNKKHYKNISSDKLDRIIILCVDEILTKKFNVDIEDEKIEVVLQLLKNSYLVRSILNILFDSVIKFYYYIKCSSCKNNDDVLDKSFHITRVQDSI
jgi:hypothetical protein|tara:strand:- start:15726 stop:16175 length:450 start_codon:yes stop_codon:yes gene_type:complete